MFKQFSKTGCSIPILLQYRADNAVEEVIDYNISSYQLVFEGFWKTLESLFPVIINLSSIFNTSTEVL